MSSFPDHSVQWWFHPLLNLAHTSLLTFFFITFPGVGLIFCLIIHLYSSTIITSGLFSESQLLKADLKFPIPDTRWWGDRRFIQFECGTERSPGSRISLGTFITFAAKGWWITSPGSAFAPNGRRVRRCKWTTEEMERDKGVCVFHEGSRCYL